jgi:imidazolonepropionase-like amidohydrolase
MFNAGMSPQQILKSATVNAADLIGQKNTLGTIEQGKIADIIAMKVNPLDNIEALLTIDFVMKSGDVVKYTDNPGT